MKKVNGHFYIDDPDRIYGCFRCGSIMGELRVMDDDTSILCGNCGEAGIIAFVQALDVLNNAYLDGEMEKHPEQEYWEEVLSALAEEEDEEEDDSGAEDV